ATMVQFEGTYMHEKDDNLNEVLIQAKMPGALRKIVCNAKPTIEIKVNGNDWTIITQLPIKNITWNFSLDQETKVEGPEGNMKAKFSLQANTLLQLGCDDYSNLVIERTFTDTAMIQTVTHKPSGIKGSRSFTRA
ncbi:unnamed protein product, partial [Meganyctiphanes norvegica]